MEYRIYWVGADGHLKGAKNVKCATDEDAAEYARALLASYPAAEVWQGKRRVAVLANRAGDAQNNDWHESVSPLNCMRAESVAAPAQGG